MALREHKTQQEYKNFLANATSQELLVHYTERLLEAVKMDKLPQVRHYALMVDTRAMLMEMD